MAYCFFRLLHLGNNADGHDSDSEKGNQRTTRKPLMHTLTNADNNNNNNNNKLTTKQYGDDEQLSKTSHWRQSKPNFNRLRSLDLTETGQGDHALPNNAASSSRRSRAHNAFHRLVHQSAEFARRRSLSFFASSS